MTQLGFLYPRVLSIRAASQQLLSPPQSEQSTPPHLSPFRGRAIKKRWGNLRCEEEQLKNRRQQKQMNLLSVEINQAVEFTPDSKQSQCPFESLCQFQSRSQFQSQSQSLSRSRSRFVCSYSAFMAVLLLFILPAAAHLFAIVVCHWSSPLFARWKCPKSRWGEPSWAELIWRSGSSLSSSSESECLG